MFLFYFTIVTFKEIGIIIVTNHSQMNGEFDMDFDDEQQCGVNEDPYS